MPPPVSAPAGRTAAPESGPGAPVPAPGERPVPAAAAEQTPLSPSLLLWLRDVHPVHRLSLSLSPLSPQSCSRPHHPCPHHLHPCHLRPHHPSLSPSPVLILLIPSLSPSLVPARCHRRLACPCPEVTSVPAVLLQGYFWTIPHPRACPSLACGDSMGLAQRRTWLRCHSLSTPCTDTCPAGTATAWGGRTDCPVASVLGRVGCQVAQGGPALPPPQCPLVSLCHGIPLP